MRCQAITKTTGRPCKMHAMSGNDRCYFHTEEECVICMDRLRRCEVCPQCKSKFCIACLERWLEKHFTCPTCRMELKKKPVDAAQPNTSNQFSFDSGETTIFSWANDEEGWSSFMEWYSNINSTVGIDTVTITRDNMQTIMDLDSLEGFEVTSRFVVPP